MKELNKEQNTVEMMENNVVEATQEQTEELVHCKKAFMTDYDKAQMLNHCKHFLDEEMAKRNISEIEQPDIDKMKIKIAVDKEIGSNFQSMMHGLTVMNLIEASDYFATRVQIREKSLSKCFKFTMEKAKEMCGDAASHRNGMAISSSTVIPWIVEYYLNEVTQKDIEEYEKELKAEEERKEKLKKAKANASKAKAKSSTVPKEPSLFDQLSEESTDEDEISTEVTETTLEVEDETSSVEEVVETTKETDATKPAEEKVEETTKEPKTVKVPQFEAISLFDL